MTSTHFRWRWIVVQPTILTITTEKETYVTRFGWSHGLAGISYIYITKRKTFIGLSAAHCLACAWNLGHHRLSTWWITKFTYGLHGCTPPAPCWRIRKDTWRPDAPVPTTYSTWWWNVIDLVFKKLFDCFTKTVKEWEKKKRMTPNRKRKMAWG
jgi:hypothetical protein